MEQTDRPIANPILVLREEFDDWAVLLIPIRPMPWEPILSA